MQRLIKEALNCFPYEKYSSLLMSHTSLIIFNLLHVPQCGSMAKLNIHVLINGVEQTAMTCLPGINAEGLWVRNEVIV